MRLSDLLATALRLHARPPKMVHRESDLAMAEAKQEKLKLRLDAEAALGVTASITAGFALSLIPESSDMGGSWQTQYAFVLFLTLAGCLALFSVITTAAIYWGGMHLLSAQKDSVREENDLFREFWKSKDLTWARYAARSSYEASFPIFLAAVVVLVFAKTNDAVLTATVAVICVTMLAYAMPICWRVSSYVLRVTGAS